MDLLTFFLYIGGFLVILWSVLRIIHLARHIDQPDAQRRHWLQRHWPWSITTYNGWNQSIPQRPVAEPFFPRPWSDSLRHKN